jgi:hypothetical protein
LPVFLPAARPLQISLPSELGSSGSASATSHRQRGPSRPTDSRPIPSCPMKAKPREQRCSSGGAGPFQNDLLPSSGKGARGAKEGIVTENETTLRSSGLRLPGLPFPLKIQPPFTSRQSDWFSPDRRVSPARRNERQGGRCGLP